MKTLENKALIRIYRKDLTLSCQDTSPAIDMSDPDPKYNDASLPPGKGTERGDMGAYGGPNNNTWP
jgi:hypothetical protein